MRGPGSERWRRRAASWALVVLAAGACSGTADEPEAESERVRGEGFAEVSIDGLRQLDHLGAGALDACGGSAVMAGGLGVADLTGDGLLDIVYPRVGEPPALALNEGGLSFRVSQLEHPDPQAFLGGGVMVAQLDGAGGPDIAISSFGTSSAALWFDDSGRFRFGGELASPEVTSGECSTNMTLIGAHVDSDASLDIAVTKWTPHLDQDRGTQVWISDGSGKYRLQALPPGETFWGANDKAVMAVALVDIDSDLRPDVFFSADWNGTGFEPGRGGARIVDRPFTDTNGMGLAVTDADLDGALEFYVSSVGAAPGHKCSTGIGASAIPCWGSRMYEIGPDGSVADVTDDYGVADTGWAWGALFADLDSDGSDELVVSNGMNVPGVATPPTGEGMLADPTGVWIVDLSSREQQALEGTEQLAGKSVVAADLDSDGDLDLVHSATADGVRIFENLHNPDASEWLGFYLHDWSPRTDSVVASIQGPQGRLTPARLAQRGGWFQTHQPAAAHFGVSQELRGAIDAGTATLVVEEVGAGHRRCMKVESTGRWLDIDVASLPPC